MNQRERKRAVTKLFRHRFHNTGFIWRSAEEQAWLDITPVGREFGSPEYERLMQEDGEKLQRKLAELVATSRANSPAVPETIEFPEDTKNIQTALKELGHDVSLDSAGRFWKVCSSSLMAGWMSGAQSVRSARAAILCYCAVGEEFANGSDYLPFESGKSR